MAYRVNYTGNTTEGVQAVISDLDIETLGEVLDHVAGLFDFDFITEVRIERTSDG